MSVAPRVSGKANTTSASMPRFGAGGTGTSGGGLAAQPPSPSAVSGGVLSGRPSSGARSRGTAGSGGSTVFQNAAASNMPVTSPTGAGRAGGASTSLPRLGHESAQAAALLAHPPHPSPNKLHTPSSPSPSQYSSLASSPGSGLPSLLEQSMSENRRFSNGMSPIPSSLALSTRPGSAEPPAFGRRASRTHTSRSNSPTSDDTGSGHSTTRPHFNHAQANARDNGEPDFEQLDEQLARSSVWRELHRVVRMCAAQPSCDRMVATLERQTRYLVGASSVRLFLVQRDGLVHHTRPQPFHHSTGIVGYVRSRKEIVNLTQPQHDERFAAEIDSMQDRPPPTAIMCVPVEADTPNSNATPGSTTGGSSSTVVSPIASGSTSTHSSTILSVAAGGAAAAGPGGKDAGLFGAGKDIVAVFQAFKEGPGEAFSTRDCKVLYRLGEFAGNMLRNSRSVDRAHALYTASLQSHKRSAALLDVAKALASETDLARVVQVIVSQVPELLDSDRCTLFFVDREREQLIVTKGASSGRAKSLVSWIFGQSNAPELPFPLGANELRFSMHNGIAGHVAMSGETLNILDAHTDPRFNASMDAQTGYRTRSMLTVPMVDSSGTIIGVVQTINKNPSIGRFDGGDETLLKTFAAQAALAVRNAQLFSRTTGALKQSDALLEVTKALSQELKIEALIQIVCSKVQQLLGSERCTVFILDKERRELYTSAHMSFGMGAALPIDQERSTMFFFPMDRGIAGNVATTLQPVNIPDAYKDPRFNKNVDKETGFRTRSILCMAITNHRKECVGVVQVMNKEAGTFDEADEKLLEAFCAQAAVAIENSRLFLQTERALNHALADQRNMKFMLSVTKNLFSDMHLTSMIDQMTMQVHHLLKADDCAVYLVDDVGKEFWVARDDSHVSSSSAAAGGAATSGAQGDPPKKFGFGVGIVGVVASTGDTIRISSAAHADARFSPLVDQRKGRTTHSILCCPIKAELPDGSSKIVGVISVRDEKDRGGFEQEEEKLLKVFCAQAAVAIMNSKRFATIMDQAESSSFRSDHSAADYLKTNRGMKLASDDIGTFQFKMEDIKMKGAIGTGSYGEVYRAEVNGGHVVAVKKLHVRNLKAEQVDAFCKEASLMCQLNHPNIVGFIGAVTEPSNLSIITEYCLVSSAPVAMADGSPRAVGLVRPGERLCTEDGEVTTVLSNRLETRTQMIRIRLEDGNQYDVTPEHTLVLTWAANPTLKDTAPHTAGGYRAIYLEYCDKQMELHTVPVVKYRLVGDDQVDHAGDDAATGDDVSESVQILPGLQVDSEVATAIARQKMADVVDALRLGDRIEISAERYTQLWEEGGRVDQMSRGCRALFAPLPHLRSIAPNGEEFTPLASKPFTSPLSPSKVLAGELNGIEVGATDAQRVKRSLFPDAAADAAVPASQLGVITESTLSARADVVAAALQVSESPTRVAEDFLHAVRFEEDGKVRWAKAAVGDPVKVLYMLHNPLNAKDTLLDQRGNFAFAFQQLVRAWKLTGLNRLTDDGILVTALNPISSPTGEMVSEKSRYDDVCSKSMRLALETGTRTIVAFGDAARTRWENVDKLVPGVREVHREEGQVRFSFAGETVSVFTAVQPCMWTHFYSVLLVIAAAHRHAEPESAPLIVTPEKATVLEAMSCPMLEPQRLTAPATSPFEIAVIKVDSPNATFLQSSGVVTHNCSRGSLADLLLDDKIFMNFAVKIKFALEAAQGMLYLHHSNPAILHRDLKSDNLLVTQDWSIKVADFGLTRFISEKKQMTQVGTPMWMAPEIIMGKKYTEKADVYAFGIILWEILTRLEPYEEKEPMQIVVEVVNDGLRPTLPAECAESPLVPLMKDSWATQPESRPTFEKIVERLRAIQAAIPPDDNSPHGVPNTSISKAGQHASHGANIAGDIMSPTR